MDKDLIPIMFDDTVALVFQPAGMDVDGTYNVSEYRKDGTFMCGMNYITSAEHILETAWEKGLQLIPEKKARKESE